MQNTYCNTDIKFPSNMEEERGIVHKLNNVLLCFQNRNYAMETALKS